MSAKGWKAVLQLGQDEKKSELDDDDRVETVNESPVPNKDGRDKESKHEARFCCSILLFEAKFEAKF